MLHFRFLQYGNFHFMVSDISVNIWVLGKTPDWNNVIHLSISPPLMMTHGSHHQPQCFDFRKIKCNNATVRIMGTAIIVNAIQKKSLFNLQTSHKNPSDVKNSNNERNTRQINGLRWTPGINTRSKVAHEMKNFDFIIERYTVLIPCELSCSSNPQKDIDIRWMPIWIRNPKTKIQNPQPSRTCNPSQ